MIARQRVLDMALALPGSAADMPFEGDFDTTVLRHGASGKWFGLVMRVPGNRVGLTGDAPTEILNLKCDPLVSYGFKQQYPDVRAAYHMNKTHWITLRLAGDVPEDVVQMLIEMSYQLTRQKMPSSRA